MTEVPEHLLKRAQAAKEKAAAKPPVATPRPRRHRRPRRRSATSEAESRIPAHLLERARRRPRPARPAAPRPRPAAAAAPSRPQPAAARSPRWRRLRRRPVPGGHTQRLLTVVKSGSIQDVKAKPQDKVHVWPHLLIVEFVAALSCTAFVTIFSVFVNAPLQELANFNQTPNPSKAPWYFLGLQELLTMFHPMVAGVTIPGMGIFILILAPYIDRNPSNKPEDRKFAISLMTIHIMFWAVLVIIGSFFRGPGFNFVFPWREGVFFEL